MSDAGASRPRPYPPTATIVGRGVPAGAGASQRDATSSAALRRSSIWALSASAQALPVPPASSALRASLRPSVRAARKAAIAALRKAPGSSRWRSLSLVRSLSSFVRSGPLPAATAARAEREPRSTAGTLATDITAIFPFRPAPSRRRAHLCPGPSGLYRVPDRNRHIRSAEALDRPDAGRGGDVD